MAAPRASTRKRSARPRSTRARPAPTRREPGGPVVLARELAARPDDEALRAVYADALLELGGEAALRGELIHVARALAAAEAAEELRARCAALVEQLARTWKRAGLGGVERGAHGLAVTWTGTPAELAAHAPAIFEAEPLIDGLVVRFDTSDGVRQARGLAKVPELARVRRLALHGHRVRAGRPGPEGLAALLASPHWPARLETLELPLCALGDEGVTRLAAAPVLASLRVLDLYSNELHARGVKGLASSPHLARLETLRVEQNPITASGARAIAETQHLVRLSRVVTAYTWLPYEDVAPIEARFPGALVHTPPPRGREDL